MVRKQDKYHLLIEKLPAAFARYQVTFDEEDKPRDYIFMSVNTAFEEMTGRKREELIGKKYTEILSHIKFSGLELTETYEKVAQTKESVRFEIFLNQLGRWYEFTAYSDKKDSFVTFFSDITTPKRKNKSLEFVLSCTEKYIQFAFGQINYQMIADDLRELSGAFFISLNVFDEFGKKAKTMAVSGIPGSLQKLADILNFQVVGKKWDVLPRKVQKMRQRGLLKYSGLYELGYGHISRPIAQLVENTFHLGEMYAIEIVRGEEVLGEFALAMPKGKTLEDPFSVEMLAQQVGLVLMRSRAEKNVQEKEKMLSSITDNMMDMVSITDDKGVIRYISPSNKNILGYEPEEMVGKTIFEFLHPQDLKRIEQAFYRAIGTRSSGKEEFRFIDKIGSYRWLEAVGNLIVEGEGISGAVFSSRDITDRKKAEEQISYMSFHDSLTGLYNRHYLEEEIKRLDTERQLPLTIIMADLNGLKLVNDTYGHAKGDEMLKSAADILRKSCRKEDVIARWGGDEFVILLPQTSAEEAEVVCKRINVICSNTYIEDIPVSIALGAAIRDTIEKDLAEILNEAEDNMYKQKLVESRSTRSVVLNILLKALSEKSFETETHTERMLNMAMKIGEKIGLSDSELSRLAIIISLHDIGKIKIPEDSIIKKGPLSAEEWEIMKKHPEIGYRIARTTEEFVHVADDILAHHEHWDGTGYPHGLKGKEIPLLARITAIADAYEVMTSGRPYKKALSSNETATEIKKCAGTQFDPELVEVFLSILKEQGFLIELPHP